MSSVLIKDLREGGPERVASILSQLQRGGICAVDAASYRDLEILVLGLLRAEEQRKNFFTEPPPHLFKFVPA